MKKLLILVLILLFLPLAHAQIEIPKQTFTVLSGDTISFNVTLINSASETRSFYLSVFPPQLNKVLVSIYPSVLSVKPNSSASAVVYVTALKGAKPTPPVTFTISASTLAETYSKSIGIIVERKYPVYISILSLNKYTFNPNERVELTVTLANVQASVSKQYNLLIEIERPDGRIDEISKRTENIGPSSTLDLKEEYELEKYAPNGSYEVRVTLTDLFGNWVDEVSTSFTVNPVYKLPTEYTKKTVSYGLLSTQTKITVKNEGNVPTPSFYVTESFPVFLKDFFVPEVQPTETIRMGGQVTYRWLIPSLKPGESVVITYRLNLWGAWFTLLAIGTVVFFFFKYSFKPTLVKKHGLYGALREREVPIFLEIRNPSKHELRNVAIKDLLPPIVSFVPKAGTIKPKIRKRKKGTELSWKFDLIGSGDERVIVYYIKPRVEIVGTLTLPPASLSYVNERGKKKIIRSREIVLK